MMDHVVDTLNSMDRQEFADALDGIFEDSSWVALQAWNARPFADGTALHAAMCNCVRAALPVQQLHLLRAHPELGSRAPMSGFSEREQRGAGLDAGESAQERELRELNAMYREKFGFPFIVAVKGLTASDILSRFRERMHNERDPEFQECLEQVFRITAMRLEDRLKELAGAGGTRPA